MSHSMRRLLLVLVAALLFAPANLPDAKAQDTWQGPIEVYVERSPVDAPAGVARVWFLNMASGEQRSFDVQGDGFTLVGDHVLYSDPATLAVFRIWPDGRVERHPFVQPAPETKRIDWVVSPDRAWIAWTLANQASAGQIQTVTTLARADGTEPRVILTDGPDSFLRAVPVGLTNDGVFFFDRQPQGVGDYFFYRLYASMYRLDTTGETLDPQFLPFEPNCFCGAGISDNGRYFARLEQVGEAGGFDVRIWDLGAGVDAFAQTIPAQYQHAGGVLVSDDGRWVVYSLANNLALDSANSGRERYMLVLVDAASGQQRTLLFNPLLVPLLPLKWTEDGRGAILYNPRQDGTWKVILETGEIRKVAEATFVGVLD